MSESSPRDFLLADDHHEAAAAAIAMAAAGREAEVVEGVLSALAGTDAALRARLLERLRRAPGLDFLLEPLADALGDAARPQRRNAARSALAALGQPDAPATGAAIDRLGRLLEHSPDPDVRILAAVSLGETGSGSAARFLSSALVDPDPNVASAAAEALGLLRAESALPALEEAARDGPTWVRLAAVVALGRVADPAARGVLEDCLETPELADAAAHALGEIGDAGALDALASVAGPATEAALEASARILAAHPSVEPPAALRDAAAARLDLLAGRFVAEGDEEAARLMGVAGTPGAVEVLLDQLRREDRGPAALAGLQLAPAERVQAPILARLPKAAPEERTLLLAAVPALRDERSLELLTRLFEDPDAEVRGAAADVFGRSAVPLALAVLEAAAEVPARRAAAVEALGRVGAPACDLLLRFLADPLPDVRRAAAEALGRCGTPEAARTVASALSAESAPGVRAALLSALGRSGGAEAARELARQLRHHDVEVRYRAALALGRSGAGEALPPLLEALSDEAEEVRAAALRALGELGDPRGAGPAAAFLDDPELDVRRTAAVTLRELAPPEALDRLLGALRDPDWQVRLAAVRALVRLGGGAVGPYLERVAEEDPDPLVRRAARGESGGGGAPPGV